MRLVLEIGSGSRPTFLPDADVVHLDCVEGPHVELLADITHGIPTPSSVFDGVLALDVLEHIPNLVAAMDEIHRVLVDGGVLEVRVPAWGTYNHITDPTHVRGFGADSFDFFDDATDHGSANGKLYTARRWAVISKVSANNNWTFTMKTIKALKARTAWGLEARR